MTKKQKENIERFKKVVAEAKKLRSKNPKLTQPQAVKMAWAIMKGKKVSGSHKDTKSHNVNIRVVSGYTGTTRKGKKTSVHYNRVSGYTGTTRRGKKTSVHYNRVSGVMSNLATGTKTSKLAKQYLIDSIDLENYDYPVQITDVGKVKILYHIFNKEYGWAIDRYGKVKAIKEWLMGLPSSVNIVFSNYDIIELAKSWGTLPINSTERQENKILDNYWNLMANNLNQLFEKVKNKNITY
jgi:hypothetical protein